MNCGLLGGVCVVVRGSGGGRGVVLGGGVVTGAWIQAADGAGEIGGGGCVATCADWFGRASGTVVWAVVDWVVVGAGRGVARAVARVVTRAGRAVVRAVVVEAVVGLVWLFIRASIHARQPGVSCVSFDTYPAALACLRAVVGGLRWLQLDICSCSRLSLDPPLLKLLFFFDPAGLSFLSPERSA